MTRTSDQLAQRQTQRHTLLTAFAAAALMTAVGIAQAQSTTQGPRDASGSNAQNTQGLGQDTTRPGAARSDTGTMSQRSGSATSGSPATTTQTTPSASDTNREASQGITADRSTTGASGSGTMGSGSSSSMSSGGTAGSSAATTTQTTPRADDTNREASQGMTADRTSGAMGSRSGASMSDSDLRNDRTSMARAPRADRN